MRMQCYYNGYRFHKIVPVENMLYNTTLLEDVSKRCRISGDRAALEGDRSTSDGRSPKSEFQFLLTLTSTSQSQQDPNTLAKRQYHQIGLHSLGQQRNTGDHRRY
jgi:hypothetical protein